MALLSCSTQKGCVGDDEALTQQKTGLSTHGKSHKTVPTHHSAGLHTWDSRTPCKAHSLKRTVPLQPSKGRITVTGSVHPPGKARVPVSLDPSSHATRLETCTQPPHYPMTAAPASGLCCAALTEEHGGVVRTVKAVKAVPQAQASSAQLPLKQGREQHAHSPVNATACPETPPQSCWWLLASLLVPRLAIP